MTADTLETAHQADLRTFAAALDACHDRACPGGLVAARNGWAVASAARARGRVVAGSSGALAAVQRSVPAQERQLASFADDVLTLHLHTLTAALDGAVTRLGQRTSEGSNLLNRQLVQGSAADVALALSEAQDVLALPGRGDQRRWRVHHQLVGAGRTLLKLYGASSFVAEGPGRLLWLHELLGNTYVHPGSAEAEATG